MDRRKFLSTLSLSILAGTVTGLPVQAAGDSWKAEFHRALAKKPWLLGFRSAEKAEFSTKKLHIEGKLPPELQGVFYRNGPAQHEIGDMRYRHWFDGDGMVHAFRFNGDHVAHTGRFVETAKRKRETAAGRALVHGFGTALPGMERPASADSLNPANINIIQHNGELLALWEGGSAYRLDPESLETLGLKSWSKETKGAPFSAHPRFDRHGTLWNVGYAASAGALLIYRISTTGKVQDTALVKLEGMSMVHDFLVTENHIVIYVAPFTFDNSKDWPFLDKFIWQPEKGGRFLIVDKNDLSNRRLVEAPPYWIFHYANAFEDKNGAIRFDAPIYGSPAVMTNSFRDIMRGRDSAADIATFTTAVLDPAHSRFTPTRMDDVRNTEFPRIDPRKSGLRHRYTYALQSRGKPVHRGFDSIVRIDRERGEVSAFTFDAGTMVEEHVFVPTPGSEAETQGWLIGTSLDIHAGVTVLNIFDAAHVSSGPVARMMLDYPLPLGFHGNFYPA